jgi:hypothetical protein
MPCPALLPERDNLDGTFPVVPLTLHHRLNSHAPLAQKNCQITRHYRYYVTSVSNSSPSGPAFQGSQSYLRAVLVFIAAAGRWRTCKPSLRFVRPCRAETQQAVRREVKLPLSATRSFQHSRYHRLVRWSVRLVAHSHPRESPPRKAVASEENAAARVAALVSLHRARRWYRKRPHSQTPAPFSAPVPINSTDKLLLVGMVNRYVDAGVRASTAEVAGQSLPFSGGLSHAKLTNF